jgi:uncharacterized protein YwgA
MSRNDDNIDILGGILRRIGNFDPADFNENFTERLILQKTVYLMQTFGLNIGYRYSWYLRGPYSPALTRDAFSLIQRYDELPTIRFVSENAEDRFSQFLDFLNGHSHDEEWLEVVASIHFLFERSSNKDRELIWQRIKQKMPTLRRKTYDRCWDELEAMGLLGVE